MTHNQFIKLFSDFAANHYQINSFSNGQKEEITANSTIGTPTVTMWAIVQSANIDGNVLKIKYSFLFGDIINKDDSNLDEVLSDTLRIAQDFVATMRLTDYEASFQIEKQSAFTPFQDERFDNEMGGWEIDITFNSDYTQDTCQVPTSGTPAITGTSN